MKLSTTINYAGGFKEAVERVVDMEKAGLDAVWIAEAYSFDAISQVGYLAARTERVEIGTGILNVYSRTAALMAMTGAGCDYVSDGRFILGLGASGPQVVEGFHGVAYDKPMVRIREYIEACRMIWRREPFNYQGQAVRAPLPAGEGTGLGKPLKLINHPVRADIPIWWASLMGKSVTQTAQHADGWLPIFFDPEKYHQVWGDELKAGLAKRDPSLGQLQISAGGMVAIDESLTGEARDKILDFSRPSVALYVGGMGRAMRTSTTRSPRSTATSPKRSRSRTCTWRGGRTRRPRPCPARCSRRRTSSDRGATSRNASPPIAKPASRCCR